MVLDRSTGLVWMRCSVGQRWDGSDCIGEVKKFKFGATEAAALDANAQPRTAGFTDWKVPDVQELASLIDCAGQPTSSSAGIQDGSPPIPNHCTGNHPRPTITLRVFPSTPAIAYWSATPHARNPTDAWLLILSDGYVNYHHRDFGFAVRLVRHGRLAASDAAWTEFILMTPTPADLQRDARQAATSQPASTAAVRKGGITWYNGTWDKFQAFAKQHRFDAEDFSYKAQGMREVRYVTIRGTDVCVEESSLFDGNLQGRSIGYYMSAPKRGLYKQGCYVQSNGFMKVHEFTMNLDPDAVVDSK